MEPENDRDTDEPSEQSDEIVVERAPDHTMSDEDVERTQFEYSTRDPVTDRVISGPLGSNTSGPGRHFRTWADAWLWACNKYGNRFLGQIPEARRNGGNRWAVLVRFPALKELHEVQN